MENVLEGLNKEQLEAVTHSQGPLLIIAGAGTGKTSVITRRIAWLIANGLAKTDEILALTFTEKAASSMQERVDILVPYGYTDIWISTFHAFGDRILRENAFFCGLNPDFKVLTQSEAIVFFRENLFKFALDHFRPLADPTRFIADLIQIFSRARDEDISCEEYLAHARELAIKAKSSPSDPAFNENASVQLEIANAYCRYQELLSGEGLLDFANLFYLALNMLRLHPMVLKKYQEKFKYILVDEFQDTNFAQFEIVKLLSAYSNNITVVADDDQCIYRWRGAAYSNVLNFIKDFPKAKQISLIQNYRSSQAILDSAYRLIQNNNPDRFEVKSGINKRLVSFKKDPGKGPVHLNFDTYSAESDKVARIILDKVKSGDYKFRDFAILVRSNSDASGFLQALNMASIPWQFSGNQGLYSREEVKICINFLRVMANLSDSLSLYYLVTSQVYSLSLTELNLCNHYARRRNKPLYSVLKGLRQIKELDSVSREFLDQAENIISDLERYLKISREETTGRLLYSFLTDTGYLKKLVAKKDAESELMIQNIAKFFNSVRDFELVAKEDRVISFISYLNLLIEAGDDPPTVEADLDTDAVNILTIHKSKGLEFRVVFLVVLVQGRFPWPRRSEAIELPDALIKEILPVGDFHIQEERRLFYVGMTRAKEELYFTSAQDYGGKRLRKISPFVLEALGAKGIKEDKIKSSPLESIERFMPLDKTVTSAQLRADKNKVLALSYYQIDDYLTCPLKYKYVNILRVPIMEHHTVIYGRAMHEAVTKYFQIKMLKQKVSLDWVLDIFEASFDPQGFLDQNHQEERFRIGREALQKFYYSQESLGALPKFVEKEFSFIFEGNKLSGRFDRVDEDAQGVSIMDFKTSQVKDQEVADKKTKESLQLELYAFAYFQIFKKLPRALRLFFLESGIIGTYLLEEENFERIKDKIREVSSGIRSNDFSATPTYLACSYCAYNQICPSAKSG